MSEYRPLSPPAETTPRVDFRSLQADIFAEISPENQQNFEQEFLALRTTILREITLAVSEQKNIPVDPCTLISQLEESLWLQVATNFVPQNSDRPISFQIGEFLRANANGQYPNLFAAIRGELQSKLNEMEYTQPLGEVHLTPEERKVAQARIGTGIPPISITMAQLGFGEDYYDNRFRPADETNNTIYDLSKLQGYLSAINNPDWRPQNAGTAGEAADNTTKNSPDVGWINGILGKFTRDLPEEEKGHRISKIMDALTSGLHLFSKNSDKTEPENLRA